MVRPLSSLAKFSFVISNIRFSPRKRAAWRDTGMPASHYACQSPSNKITSLAETDAVLTRLRCGGHTSNRPEGASAHKPERLGWMPERGGLRKLLPAGQPRLPKDASRVR